VILEPVNDLACLSQLTTIARELSATTLIHSVAKHLGSRDGVIRWIQAKPQTDDDGKELIQFITCDVPQRVRLLAEDPNCVERATDAMMLLEALEQLKLEAPTPRALATVERPLRHTGLVEKRGDRWYAVDLFPRRNAPRNFDWATFGVGTLKGVHKYVGKPLLSFYGLGSVADTIGAQEDKLTASVGKKPEKKEAPSSRPGAKQPAASNGASSPLGVAGAVGSGAGPAAVNLVVGKGGTNGQTETRKPEAAAQGAAGGGDSIIAALLSKASKRGSDAAAARGDRDSHDARAEAERGGGWWGVR
jgi:hypothetical protein